MKKNKLFAILSVLFIFALSAQCIYAQDPLQSPPSNIDVIGVLNKIANLLIEIATPIAIIMVIVAGFYFITAQGDPGKIEKARTMILWVLIGMAVVLLAKATISFVVSMVTPSSTTP